MIKLRARKTVKVTNNKDFAYMLNKDRIYSFDPIDPETQKPSRSAQLMIEKLINLGYLELIAQPQTAETRDGLPIGSNDAIKMSHHSMVFIER